MKISSRARKILRSEMTRRFWTQAKLAQESGVSEPAVSRALRSGKAHPGNFVSICKALRIRPETLMSASVLGQQTDA